MKNFNELENWTPKKLRQLKMNLNNRIESFTYSEKTKNLGKGHMLFGMNENQCRELLKSVQVVQKNALKQTK